MWKGGARKVRKIELFEIPDGVGYAERLGLSFFFLAISGIGARQQFWLGKRLGVRRWSVQPKSCPTKSRVPGLSTGADIARTTATLLYSRTRPEFDSSASGAIVVVQHAAQAPPSLHVACVTEVARFWADEVIRQALVIALAMIRDNEVLNGCPQRLLPEEDHAFQAGLF